MKLFLNIFCWWWCSSEINHFSQCYSLVAPLKFSSCFLQEVDMEATEGRLGKLTTFYFLKNKITKITMRSLLHKNPQHLHFFSAVKSAWCSFPSIPQLRLMQMQTASWDHFCTKRHLAERQIWQLLLALFFFTSLKHVWRLLLFNFCHGFMSRYSQIQV